MSARRVSQWDESAPSQGKENTRFIYICIVSQNFDFVKPNLHKIGKKEGNLPGTVVVKGELQFAPPGVLFRILSKEIDGKRHAPILRNDPAMLMPVAIFNWFRSRTRSTVRFRLGSLFVLLALGTSSKILTQRRKAAKDFDSGQFSAHTPCFEPRAVFIPLRLGVFA